MPIATQNVTLVPLPPKCPKLNPVEKVWQLITGVGGLSPGARSIYNPVDADRDGGDKAL